MRSDISEKPKRRSPIKSPPLRMPGESLQEEIAKIVFDRWLGWGAAMLVAWALVIPEWVHVAFHTQVTWKLALFDTGFPVIVTTIAIFSFAGRSPACAISSWG